jgi:hypothetical protein
MMRYRFVLWILALLLPAQSGCGDSGPQRKKTYPVSGEVRVDGQPASGVAVLLNDGKGMDPSLPTVSQAMTDDQGKFRISTYDDGDGAPDGEYTLTFTWGELNLMSMQYDGDKLQGKYNDAEKSEFKAKVQGQPVDLGRLELTTKK